MWLGVAGRKRGRSWFSRLSPEEEQRHPLEARV